MNCQRMKCIERTWENSWTGEMESEWVTVPECDFYDTSLHSYACRTCGEKFWYSQRGRIAEERGVSVYDVPALDAAPQREGDK
jgi:hypothetical protein